MDKHMKKITLWAGLLLSPFVVADEEADLANQLNNPVAALISVPVDCILDENIGPDEDGEVTLFKFAPVIPIELNDEWNIISRTIVSVADQEDIPVRGEGDSGLTDIAQSVFFSPKAPTAGGWIWGAGFISLLDTATEDELGAGKWGLGPTAVVLRQQGPWTVGALSHYLTDIAGDGDRADVEQVFLQPFLSYTIARTKTTFTFFSETTRDLEESETSTVGTFHVGQMFKVGSQIMQARVGVRHWFDSTDLGPDSTTFTARLTLLFPK